MSVLVTSVADMDDLEAAALVLAACEVSPGEPSDVTEILRDPDAWEAVGAGRLAPTSSPLARYLSEAIDPGRVEYWHKLLDQDVRLDDRYHVVLASAPDYPERLALAWGAPPLLFTQGTLPGRLSPAVAVVGAREADERTLRAAWAVGNALVRAGAEVVSGLARGADAAAHRGALAAGRTTAVLGTGITRVFPPGHEDLTAEIARSGAVISEFAPYAPPTGTTFLRRNATIAGLSSGLVVMDAARRSGSRHAAERAIDLGRPVLLWADSLQTEPWARELHESGRARFVADAEEVVELVGGVGG